MSFDSPRREARGRMDWMGLCARLSAALLLVASLAVAPIALAAGDQDLADLELEDLFNMEVTSLTKSASRFQDTPAAIFVLTNEDIRRSGVRSIPEALRMVPGLQVAQLSGNKWAISARGFNSIFSDKMLVLIDGRSVYTPLFAGVYWDVQDTMLEDIDRIEVIRGPGGTLWGANAVNGVINIVTKTAAETQGALVTGGGGDVERGFVGARIGAEAGDHVQYRTYFKYNKRTKLDDPDPANGAFAFDATEMYRGGARLDVQLTENGNLTISGEFYDGSSDNVAFSVLGATAPFPPQPRLPTVGELRGGHALVNYNHALGDLGDLMAKFYYDRSQRADVVWGEVRNTYDLEFQHSFDLSWLRTSWGAQYRRTNDAITPGFETTYNPAVFAEDLFTSFVQFEAAFFERRLQVMAGTKVIYNDHTQWEWQPSARFAVIPISEERGWGQHTIWGAVTRAVRIPSRSIDNIEVRPPGAFGALAVAGNPNALSEIVYAFEGGYRVQPIEKLQIDIAGYYNLYRRIYSLEASTAALPFIPFLFGNLIEGDGYGIEVSTTVRPVDWWKLHVGYTWGQLNLNTLPGSMAPPLPVGIGTPSVSAGLPKHQVQVSSTVGLPWDFEFDQHLYYVDTIPLFSLNSYIRLDLRLGWQATEWLELFVSGMNLTEDRHQEWAYEFEYTNTVVPRSFLGGATITY